MTFDQLVNAIRKQWIVVVAVLVIGAFLGMAASWLVSASYTSETELFVNVKSGGTVAELQQGEVFAQARAQSYVVVATTPLVLTSVVEKLALTISPGELASQMNVAVEPGTVIIKASVSAGTPEEATKLAQAIGDSLKLVAAQLDSGKADGVSPVELVTLTAATEPSKPSSPNRSLNIALGSVSGLVIGLVIASFRVRRRDLGSHRIAESALP